MNKTEELLRANIERIDAEIKHLVKVVNYYLGERLPFLTIEFDCPVCKHMTLAKKIITSSQFYFINTSTSNFPAHWEDYCDKFGMYCYTCGNTFEKKESTEWVKVKKEG